MIKGVTRAHLGPICYHSEPSDIPYSQNQFLGWDFFYCFLQQDGFREILSELRALYCDHCGEKVCSVPGWLAGVAADAQALNPIPTIKLTDRDDGKVHRPLQQQYQLPASGLRENQKLWSGTFLLCTGIPRFTLLTWGPPKKTEAAKTT